MCAAQCVSLELCVFLCTRWLAHRLLLLCFTKSEEKKNTEIGIEELFMPFVSLPFFKPGTLYSFQLIVIIKEFLYLLWYGLATFREQWDAIDIAFSIEIWMLTLCFFFHFKQNVISFKTGKYITNSNLRIWGKCHAFEYTHYFIQNISSRGKLLPLIIFFYLKKYRR